MIRAPLGSLGSHPGMQAYLASKPDSVFAKYMGGGQQPAMNPNDPNMMSASIGIPTFATGGMMGENGAPIRPGQPMPSQIPMDEPQLGADAPPAMDPAQIEQEAKMFVKQNPQVAQQVQAIIAHAIQTGELTPDELNMAVQLAKTALANPASYPQVRAFAIKNGLGTEAELPQEMDKGLLFTLLLAGNSMGATPAKTAPAGNAMQGQPPAGIMPTYKEGGMTGDKAHIAQLDPHEYVATKEALLYHGKKTYDKLEEQARAPKDDAAKK